MRIILKPSDLSINHNVTEKYVCVFIQLGSYAERHVGHSDSKVFSVYHFHSRFCIIQNIRLF